MNQTVTLSCACGSVAMEATGAPLWSVECLCNSCREAARVFESLSGAVPIREATGGTRVEMYRKDRVRCCSGSHHLREHRLTATTKTRRVVATCCNTPMFLDFTQGHWIDLYTRLWPEGDRPPLQMRTMAGDLDDASALPGDVPNLKTHSIGFFVRLLSAWVAMGFRSHPVNYVEGKLNVPATAEN